MMSSTPIEEDAMESNWYKIFPIQILTQIARIPDPTMHGDFLLLAMHCLEEGGLPDDDAEIAWITRLAPDRVQQMRPYINRLSDVVDGKLMIRFIGEVIRERVEYAERRSAAGKQGGRLPKPDAIEDDDFPPTTPTGNGRDKSPVTETKDLRVSDADFVEESNAKQCLDGEKQCLAPESNVYQFEARESQYNTIQYNTNNTSPSEKQPKSPRRSPESNSTRAPNPQLAYFDEKYRALYGLPYPSAKKDFVQLAHLRKACDTAKPEPWALTEERWRRGVDNYFASSLGNHTLADLCVRFGTFYRNALDRFGRPTAPTNAAANGGIEPKRQVVV